MRPINVNMYMALLRDSYTSFVLIQIGPWPHNGTYTRFNSSGVPITATDPYLGTVFYPADFPLISIDPPRISSEVDREAYRFTVSDPDFLFKPLLDSGAVGTQIVMRAGVMEEGVTSLTSVGSPRTAPIIEGNMLSSLFVLYKGRVDRHVYNITEEGEVILTFECSSPMGALGLKRVMVTSRDWLRQRYPGDASFDRIYEGSQQQILQWGKGAPQPAKKVKKSGGFFGRLFG